MTWDSKRWTIRVVWSGATRSNHVVLQRDGTPFVEMELDEWLRLVEATVDLRAVLPQPPLQPPEAPAAAPSPLGSA
jgi:hypothetical protein